MGDEMHQRNVACTEPAAARARAGAGARRSRTARRLARLFEFIGGNDQFFLNVAMAMGKAITDPVRGIAGSSVVTAMSRNGTMFGIRVSGLGDRWFTAPVEMPRGLYFPGFSEADANPDMGDSTIVETVGLGGFAMAAAPAVAGLRRRGDGGGRARLHPRDGGDRRRAQPGMDHPRARLRRRPDRASTSARWSASGQDADHQYRHRPPGGRNRPGRGGGGARADGLLRASALEAFAAEMGSRMSEGAAATRTRAGFLSRFGRPDAHLPRGCRGPRRGLRRLADDGEPVQQGIAARRRAAGSRRRTAAGANDLVIAIRAADRGRAARRRSRPPRRRFAGPASGGGGQRQGWNPRSLETAPARAAREPTSPSSRCPASSPRARPAARWSAGST